MEMCITLECNYNVICIACKAWQHRISITLDNAVYMSQQDCNNIKVACVEVVSPTKIVFIFCDCSL